MGTDLGEPWCYEDDLNAYALFLCRDPEDAEDVAHTALLKAAEQMSGFRGESSMRTWLHSIVANECRMLRRRTPWLSFDQMVQESSAAAPWVAEESSYSADPTDSAEQGELKVIALATLREMPSHYRAALFFQLALGMPIEEIAAALGRTVPATKSVLHRARRSMREGVAEHLERDAEPD